MTSAITDAAADHGLARLAHARVGDAMRRGVVVCGRDASARTLARKMSARHIHCVVIADEDRDGSWAVVSALDLVGLAGVPFEERMAAAAAARAAIAVDADATLEDAAYLMAEHRVEHLLVVEDGRPVGMLSTLDVADVIARGEAR